MSRLNAWLTAIGCVGLLVLWGWDGYQFHQAKRREQTRIKAWHV